jgi:hypothetical protein
MNRNNLDSGCKALAKTGKPCRAAATAGGLCFFHANPAKASELGRSGAGAIAIHRTKTRIHCQPWTTRWPFGTRWIV